MCHILCDTASAKKPPTPKNEKGNKNRESIEVTFSVAWAQCHSLIQSCIRLGQLLAGIAPSLFIFLFIIFLSSTTV